MGHEGASASIRWQIQIYKTLDVGKSIAYEEERERRRRGCARKTWYVSTTFVDLDLSECRRSDMRTYYVFFILSFIDSETSSLVKSTFLEQQRDIFLSIFKVFLKIRIWSSAKSLKCAGLGCGLIQK
jgi:hypothetical protein